MSLVCSVHGEVNLNTLAAQMAAKWSTITTGTQPHACIEIENHAILFFMVNMASGMDSKKTSHMQCF